LGRNGPSSSLRSPIALTTNDWYRWPWKGSVPGGASGLQIREGLQAGPWWVQLPLSSATASFLDGAVEPHLKETFAVRYNSRNFRCNLVWPTDHHRARREGSRPAWQRGTGLTRSEAARLRRYQHTVAPRYGRYCQAHDAQLAATPRAGNGGRLRATALHEAILIAHGLGSTVH
jgi:hypothetical protein